MNRQVPTLEEVKSYLRDHRNWGRWGEEDQAGAVNLIQPAKRIQAAALVRTGRIVSLSRPFPTKPGPDNPTPAQHWMRRRERAKGGGAVDYLSIAYHGIATTHIDALCHTWDEAGMWNGRDPDNEITFEGSKWASIEQWKDGIVTRGVLLDVPKHRREPYVAMDNPVHAWELEEIAQEEGVKIEPGDALVVYSGRENWNKANRLYGSRGQPRPGLHASCLKFIRDTDVSLLVWDMLDWTPSGYDLPWTVHGALFAYGVGLLDNALLQPLAEACSLEGRYEFMLVVSPLWVPGGTGSPVNPLALF